MRRKPHGREAGSRALQAPSRWGRCGRNRRRPGRGPRWEPAAARATLDQPARAAWCRPAPIGRRNGHALCLEVLLQREGARDVGEELRGLAALAQHLHPPARRPRQWRIRGHRRRARRRGQGDRRPAAMTPPSSEAATVAATTITAQREDYRVGRTEAVTAAVGWDRRMGSWPSPLDPHVPRQPAGACAQAWRWPHQRGSRPARSWPARP